MWVRCDYCAVRRCTAVLYCNSNLLNTRSRAEKQYSDSVSSKTMRVCVRGDVDCDWLNKASSRRVDSGRLD